MVAEMVRNAVIIPITALTITAIPTQLFLQLQLQLFIHFTSRFQYMQKLSKGTKKAPSENPKALIFILFQQIKAVKNFVCGIPVHGGCGNVDSEVSCSSSFLPSASPEAQHSRQSRNNCQKLFHRPFFPKFFIKPTIPPFLPIVNRFCCQKPAIDFFKILV